MLALTPEQLIDDKYRIIEQLGTGGMGAVYKAEQIKLGRIVAIKFLHDFLLGEEESRIRFKREAKALASLQNAHVSLFFGYGFWQKKIPYIVMEYLQGQTLQQALSQEGALSWKRTLFVAKQIAEGLGYCHKAGIIHRDLKPSNIFLQSTPQADFVKVTDFGLVKFAAPIDTNSLTKTGLLIGSAHYMSPEQCQGKPATASSDIYALGCLLFQLITGNHPYEADTALGLIYKHINETIPPLTVSAPTELEELIQSCLAKDPALRPASMLQLAERMGDILKEYENADVSQSSSSRLTPPRKRPLLITFTIIFLLLLIAGLARNVTQGYQAESGQSQLTRLESLEKADRLIKFGDRENAIRVLEDSWHDVRMQRRSANQLMLESKLLEAFKRYHCEVKAQEEASQMLLDLASFEVMVEFDKMSLAKRRELTDRVITLVNGFHLPPSQRLFEACWHLPYDSVVGSGSYNEMIFNMAKIKRPSSAEYQLAFAMYVNGLLATDQPKAAQLLFDFENEIADSVLPHYLNPTLQNSKQADQPDKLSSIAFQFALSSYYSSGHRFSEASGMVDCVIENAGAIHESPLHERDKILAKAYYLLGMAQFPGSEDAIKCFNESARYFEKLGKAAQQAEQSEHVSPEELARLKIQQKKYADAENLLQHYTAYLEQAGYWSMNNLLWSVKEDRAGYKGAEDDYRKIASNFTDARQVEALILLGIIQHIELKEKEAQCSWAKAVELAKQFKRADLQSKATEQMAIMKIDEKNYADAERDAVLLEQAGIWYPSYLLGWVREKQGKYNQAEEAYRRITAHCPDAWRIAALIRAGVCQHRQLNNKEAACSFTKAVDLAKQFNRPDLVSEAIELMLRSGLTDRLKYRQKVPGESKSGKIRFSVADFLPFDSKKH